MKNLNLIFFLNLILMAGCQYSTESFDEVGGVVFQIQLNPEVKDEKKSLDILKKRLDEYKNSNYEWIDLEENKIEIKVSKSFYSSSFQYLFKGSGKVQFCEVMGRDEFEPYVSSLDSLALILYSQRFYDLIDKNPVGSNSSCLGIVSSENKSKVNALLVTAEKKGVNFPKYPFRFKEIENGMTGQIIYMLYLLKMDNPNTLEVSIDQLEKLSLTMNPQTGQKEIVLEFNEVNAENWKNLTTKNVKKEIAIVLDNKIISAPRVNSPIESGRVAILFGDEKQTEIFAAILKNEALPQLAFEIVDTDYFLPQDNELLRINDTSDEFRGYDFIRKGFKNNILNVQVFIRSATLDQKIKSALLSDIKNIIKLDFFEYVTLHNFSQKELGDVIMNAKKIIRGSREGGQPENPILELEKLINEAVK